MLGCLGVGVDGCLGVGVNIGLSRDRKLQA